LQRTAESVGAGFKFFAFLLAVGLCLRAPPLGDAVIQLQEEQGVAVLRLAHGKANAFDNELCRELKTTLDRLGSAPVTSVVLTAEGKIFSAGLDLLQLLNGDDNYRRTLLKALGELLQALFFFPKPVVAALNGHAIAGGCIVACAADYRVMARAAGRVGVPELLVGVPFPAIALEIVRFAVAPQHLRQLLFRGLTCPSDQALAWGLVDELVDGEVLCECALARARELGAIPAKSFELSKRHARAPVRERLREPSTQQLDADVAQTWNSPETLAAMRRYVEQTLKK
jgi:enoyl-CoA hydratase